MRRLLGWEVVLCLIAGLAARAEEPDVVAEGALGAAREPLRRLVSPVIRDGRLVLDRSGWPKGVPGDDPEMDREGRRREFAEGLSVPIEAVPDHLIDGDGAADPAPLFEAIMKSGGGSSEGAGSHGGGPRVRRHADGSALLAWLTTDEGNGSIALRLVEREGARRTLDVEEVPARGISLRFDDPEAGVSFVLTTSSDGRVSFVGRAGGRACALCEADFAALLRAAPDEVSAHLLRPLAGVGLSVAPDRCLPEVVAAATSGFGAAAPETAREADRWIARLSEDEAESREEASAALHALFPRAIRHIEEALARATDAEARDRLRAVIAARPDIAQALAYVKGTGLHEDRAYLLDVLGRVPSYRASARTRLAELVGKDFGDDPSAWPAEK